MGISSRAGVLLIMAVLLCSFVLASPSAVHAIGPTIVQSSSVYRDLNAPTVGFESSVTSGNVIVVAIDVENFVTNVISSVTDSLGTTYMEPAASPSIIVAAAGGAYIYYGTATSTGPDIITIHMSGSDIGSDDIFAYEVAGITTSSATASAGADAASVTATLSTSATAFTTEGFLIMTTETLKVDTCASPGAGFTCASEPEGDSYGLTEYSTSGVSSPTTFPMTLNQADYWDAVGVAFNSGTATPPPPPPLVCPSTLGGIYMPVGAIFTDTRGNTWVAPSGNLGGGKWSSYFFAGSLTSLPPPLLQGWAGDFGTYNGQQGWVVTFYC